MVYAYLVFTRYLVRIDLSSTTGRLEKVADFIEQNLPVCPGVFPHDSKVYFVGGEKFNENCRRPLPISSTRGLDTSYGDKGRSASVYVLGSDNHFYRDPVIPNTNAAKVKPMVATLNGKIYVLSTCSYFDSSIELPYPVFECYDSSSTGLCSWETLPEPPHYRENDYGDDYNDDGMMSWGATSVANMFVFENKIFINNCFGVSYYHTCDREWKTLQGDDWIDTSTPSPFMGDCFAQGKDGVVIAFTEEKKMLMAYMFDDQQLLKSHQELVDMYSYIPFPQSPFGFIRHFGNNRFCFVIFERDFVGSTTAPFVVLKFKIRTIPEDGNFVFNATMLDVQICFLDDTIPFEDDQHVHDVFIM